MLEGRIVAHVEFHEPVEIAAGESVYIDSNMDQRQGLLPISAGGGSGSGSTAARPA